jgi:hypothetical protein
MEETRIVDSQRPESGDCKENGRKITENNDLISRDAHVPEGKVPNKHRKGSPVGPVDKLRIVST